MTETENSAPLFVPGQNCWKVARAEKLALIVDAANYFRMLRRVVTSAQRELLLIGWDFEFEIEMLPGESDADGLAPDGLPNTLGNFLEAVIERNLDLKIYILKWNGAVLIAPGQALSSLQLRAFGNDRINFALDGHHPFGACHHQKIVVADDKFAFCGGIDVTKDRWDTYEHLPEDDRRNRPDGTPTGPWHDATTALTGPIATSLGELARKRWERATGERLDHPGDLDGLDWPQDLPIDVRDVDIAIARTEPPFDGEELINEIERLCLDIIESATDVIYIESQYFAAETICQALEDRLREPDGPEVVVINPQAALSALEDDAMHVLRGRMIDRLKKVDPGNRFRIYYPSTTAGGPIYVHAKIMIADDRVLRIGSSNIDNRSLGFDTECDIAIEGSSGAATMIDRFRSRLLAEHLGSTTEAFDRARQDTGSLIGAIDRLNSPEGRGLRPIRHKKESILGDFLANTRLFDMRYYPGEGTSAGRGLRPRHYAIVAGGLAFGLAGWYAWRHWARGRGTK